MKKLLFYKEFCDSVLKMRAFEVVLVKQSREKQNQKKIPAQSRKKMESKKVIIRLFSPYIPAGRLRVRPSGGGGRGDSGFPEVFPGSGGAGKNYK